MANPPSIRPVLNRSYMAGFDRSITEQIDASFMEYGWRCTHLSFYEETDSEIHVEVRHSKPADATSAEKMRTLSDQIPDAQREILTTKS